MSDNPFESYAEAIEAVIPFSSRGRINQVIGMVVESLGPPSRLGDVCEIRDHGVFVGITEVVGFRKETTLLMALGSLESMRPGMEVVNTGQPLSVSVGKSLLGRVLDGLGKPMDGKGPLVLPQSVSLFRNPPHPLDRKRIREPFSSGVRAIDGLKTLGKGQRVGIFAGSGVGKSVLMGMIARHCRADVNVIALIGERGREVREFIEKDLGEEGLRRSVLVIATSDQPAVVRLKAALTATSIAEYFRDQGKDVMMMLDSSTRLAHAQREIGLAIGEPPTTRGYTPSVFNFLPKLFERAGTGPVGSITGLYTVLVEGDDMDEPVADAVRSILDGHIVLSRELANRGHYPAIDVLKSVSRCQSDVISDVHKKNIAFLLHKLALYRESEDMIQLGAYARGSNPELDTAIELMPSLNLFLSQAAEKSNSLEETLAWMVKLVGNSESQGMSLALKAERHQVLKNR